MLKISQCLVVKNDEKNIEQALSYAKSLVCEQIVVDLGSTDNTIEIAKKMGAKVYNYDFKNDFSEVKNFAISNSIGDWIIFLDVNEYVKEEDVDKITHYIENCIKYNDVNKDNLIIDSIKCQNFELKNDKISSVTFDEKIFRRSDDIFYQNKYKEKLFNKSRKLTVLSENYITTYKKIDNLDEKNEFDLNVLKNIVNEIQIECEKKNEKLNFTYFKYLADCYYDLNRYNEAINQYLAIIQENKYIIDDKYIFIDLLKRLVRICIIMENSKKNDMLVAHINDVYNDLDLKNPDYELAIAEYYLSTGNNICIKYLEKSLDTFYNSNDSIFSQIYKFEYPFRLYIVYKYLGKLYGSDSAKSIKYFTKSLSINKYEEEVLQSLFVKFKNDSAEEVYKFLSKIYNFSELRDKLFVIRCEKAINQSKIKKIIIDNMTNEEREFYFSKIEDYIIQKNMKIELFEKYNFASSRTNIDYEFLDLIEKLSKMSEEEILTKQIEEINSVKTNYGQFYLIILEYLNIYKNWGKLNIGQKNYEFLDKKIKFLKKYMSEFLDIYKEFDDFLSKKTFLSILKNWFELDYSLLSEINNKNLFDLDIINFNNEKDLVIVDVGSKSGENIIKFVNTYLNEYKRIYSFEIDDECIESLRDSLDNFENTIVRNIAISDKTELIYKQKLDSYLGYKISKDIGESFIETTTLDEIIDEKISLLIVDTNGNELDVINGSVNSIIKYKPKLIISAHYNIEDIVEIIKRIKKIREDYKIYIRYLGSNAVTDKIFIYAI